VPKKKQGDEEKPKKPPEKNDDEDTKSDDDGLLSLHPLTLEEALEGLLNTPTPDDDSE